MRTCWRINSNQTQLERIMKKNIITLLAFCHTLCGAQTLTIGTNTLGIIFVDDTLSLSQKEAIVADMQMCVDNPWGDRAYVYTFPEWHIKSDVIGSVSFGTETYAYNGFDFPREIVTNNAGVLLLRVSQALSDAYTNAFVFAAANSNIVAAANEFVSFIAYSNMVVNVSSNTIMNYLYYPNVSSNSYASAFESLMSNFFSGITYYPPSLLGFSYDGNSTNASNYKLRLLCSSPPWFYDMNAIWHDNRWKLLIK